jgi:hypothetical protein
MSFFTQLNSKQPLWRLMPEGLGGPGTPGGLGLNEFVCHLDKAVPRSDPGCRIAQVNAEKAREVRSKSRDVKQVRNRRKEKLICLQTLMN